MSALAIGGGLSRSASAATTWTNATGWMGNQAIYMSVDIYPGVTGSGIGTDSRGFGSNVLPEWSVSAPANTKGVNNSVGVAVGVRSQDAIKNMMFYEYYDGTAGILRVYIPVAVIGAGYTYLSNPYGMIDIECLYASVRNMYLPHVGMQIWQSDTFGINATGTLADQGTPPIQKAQNDLMADTWWTAVEALVKGTPVGTWASMYQAYVAAAKAVASPNVESFLPPQGGSAAGKQIIHSYNVINNSYWNGFGQSPTYDVFGTTMYVEVDVNKTDFSTYPPGNWTFGVYGYNWMNSHWSGCYANQVQAASIDLDLYAYPAIEVEGTIYSAGAAAPNAALSLSDGGSNVYTFSTNSQGNYRFFAKPGTTYTLTATYGGTTVGTVQGQTTFTTGTDPTAPPKYANLVLPVGAVAGTVYSAKAPVANEAVSFYDGSTLYTVTTNSQGNYVFIGKSGASYMETASIGTTFGNAQFKKAVTPPLNSTTRVNPVLPVSYVQGTVTDYSGSAVYKAKVTVTSPSGYQTYVCTDSYGKYFFYTNGAGTYTYNSVGSYYYAQAGPYSYYFGVNLTYSGYNFVLGSGSSTGCGSPPGGGGGGGCLLSGTQVLLPGGGTTVINKLKVGQAVLGYNVTTGAWVTETVTSINYTFVRQVLSIDNGLLVATLMDQPLYVRNGTWTGWIRDPQDLIPGEQLFLPTTGTWVNVTSLQILTDHYKVYDLRVIAPNDFVANGVLVGDKPIPT